MAKSSGGAGRIGRGSISPQVQDAVRRIPPGVRPSLASLGQSFRSKGTFSRTDVSLEELRQFQNMERKGLISLKSSVSPFSLNTSVRNTQYSVRIRKTPLTDQATRFARTLIDIRRTGG